VAIAVHVWRVEAGYGGMVRKFLSCGIGDEGDKLVFCEFKGCWSVSYTEDVLTASAEH